MVEPPANRGIFFEWEAVSGPLDDFVWQHQILPIILWGLRKSASVRGQWLLIYADLGHFDALPEITDLRDLEVPTAHELQEAVSRDGLERLAEGLTKELWVHVQESPDRDFLALFMTAFGTGAN